MLNATLSQRLEVTDSLVIFAVQCDQPIPDFLPGQYVALGLFPEAPRPADFPPEEEGVKPGKLIKRSYSIASSPHEKSHLEFYVAIVPEGALTSRFMLLRENDRLHVGHKITGTFTLKDVPQESNLVLVATGTGIAPFISMIRHPDTWEGGRRITLIHGVRYAPDLGYRDECLALQEREPRFSYFATISRDDPTWQGERGYVQDYISSGRVECDPGRDHVFLCGNPRMVGDLEELLKHRGFTEHSRRAPGNMHVEKYW